MTCKHCGQPIVEQGIGIWWHVYTNGQLGRRECPTRLAAPSDRTERNVIGEQPQEES